MALHEVLSPAAERAAARKIRQGDEKALKTLVEANQGFAIYMAKRFGRHPADHDDLVQEANVGLLLAARHFDPDRGTRFTTYAAWWVEARLRRFLAHRNSMLKVSDRTRRVARRLLRAEEKLLQERQGVTLKMVAESEDIDIVTAELVLGAATSGTLSLDQMGNEDGAPRIIDRVADGSSERDFSVAEAQAVLASSMKVLTITEWEVVKLRYFDECSYTDIAAELGVSSSRVYQIETKALQRLRRTLFRSAA